MSMWDMVQQAQIRGLVRSQGMGEVDALMRDRRQEERAEQLEQRIEHLSDVVEAMWDLLTARLGVADADLQAALDVVVQRRVELAKPVRCAKCGAAVLRSEDHCQFCGEARTAEGNQW